MTKPRRNFLVLIRPVLLSKLIICQDPGLALSPPHTYQTFLNLSQIGGEKQTFLFSRWDKSLPPASNNSSWLLLQRNILHISSTGAGYRGETISIREFQVFWILLKRNLIKLGISQIWSLKIVSRVSNFLLHEVVRPERILMWICISNIWSSAPNEDKYLNVSPTLDQFHRRQDAKWAHFDLIGEILCFPL